MWLQRCTDNISAARLLLPTAVLVLAGCASSGPKPAATSHADARPDGSDPAAMLMIPAQAQTLFEQAVSVMAGGDFLEAELRLKDFLLRYPGFPGAHVNLAIIHSNNGDDAAARAAIDAALALDANHAPALNQQGMLLRRNGKFVAAEAAYLKAVTASPDYALAHYNLGVLNELYLQRLDTALKHFERYQALVGEDKQVEKWIADLRRRVAASQRTANVAE